VLPVCKVLNISKSNLREGNSKRRAEMKLANKVSVITGAGSGIGRATAILFAEEGSSVVVVDINDAGGEETVAAVKGVGREAIFVHTDVSSATEVKNLIQKMNERFGKIDIIFNSAGIGQKPGSVEKFDEETWDRIFAVNVKSIFLMIKFAVPLMKGEGKGSIINIASIGGVRPRPGMFAYASSKAAAIILTKALALDLARFNIRVNVINPVAIDTPMLASLYPKGPEGDEYRKRLVSTIPLGRILSANDVAYAGLYLASDESAMVTGICIDVDGGRGI
jgi:3-oxoacyl-[acyl-carrier protein] reductase